MKQIFITGATGFVGTSLIHKLLEQDNVHLPFSARFGRKIRKRSRFGFIKKQKRNGTNFRI